MTDNIITVNNTENNAERQKRREFKRRESAKRRREFKKLKNPQDFTIPVTEKVQEILDIQRVSPDGIWEVGENLYSKTYLLNDLNYCMKTYNEQVAFFGEWCRILNSFDDIVLGKITVFNKYRDMTEFKEKILYQHKPDDYNLHRDCYNSIINSKIVDGCRGIEQVKYFTVTISRSNFYDARQGMLSIEANILKEFGSLGSVLIPLNTTQKFHILNSFFKMGKEDTFKFDFKDTFNNCRDWRNDILNGYVDFKSNKDYFFTENKCCKALYVDPDSYPDDDLSDEFFHRVINLQSTSVFSLDFVPVKRSATKNALEENYVKVQDKIIKQQQNRNSAGNFSSEISYPVAQENKNIKEMLDDVNENGQEMFWVSLSAMLMADNLDNLDDTEDALMLIADNYGIRFEDYGYRQREALNTVLPIGGRYTDEMRSMFTRMLAIHVPFKSMEMQHKKKPLYYGINRETKNIIMCNRKLLTNGNGFVFGVTGAGKSMTGGKLEMGSVFLNTDDDIIILDPTLEYKDVARTFKGAYVDIGPDAENHINPLHIDVNGLSPTNIKAVIAQKSTIMCGICEHAMEEEFTKGCRSIVDRCVKQMFEALLTTPVEQRTVPIMSDFYRMLKDQTDPEVHSIILGLEVFISGSMNIFNHPNNVNVNNRLLVFGLRDMEELESVGMLVVLSHIRQKIIKNASEGRATWLYVDEFHELMDKQYSRKYLISLWKKVRKLGGICTGLTQNLTDVSMDKATRKLISNSEYTMFLRSGVGEVEDVIRTFEGRLTEAHIKYIDNAAKGTGIIRFGNVIIPFDGTIEKDNLLYDLYNTNFFEKAALKQAMLKSLA